MGQEISIHNTRNTNRHLNLCTKQQRHQGKEQQQQQQYYEKSYEYYKNLGEDFYLNEGNYHILQQQQICLYPKESLYSLSSTSNASTTDNEYYKYCQKYNLTKQSYEKSKIVKQKPQQQQQERLHHDLLFPKKSLTESITSSSSAATSTTDITTTTTTTATNQRLPKFTHFYAALQKKRQKYRHKSSQSSLDSSIYYTSWPNSTYKEAGIESVKNCLSEKSLSKDTWCTLSHLKQYTKTDPGRRLDVDPDQGSAVSTASAISHKSNKSLQQQKHYLDHHLYIKSYLDILEEDEKAKALYPAAKPGGIRNYRPKILADNSLSASAPSITNHFSSSINSEDPWI